VESRYKLLKGDGGYGFAVGAYDPRYPLVIDPGLNYSTFLGGGGGDYSSDIAVDRTGRAYVMGTVAFSPNYPTTPGAFDTTFNGGEQDAFVTKPNASGSALDYSTFLGGGDIERGWDIAVDRTGRAYVTGQTESADYLTTLGAFDTSFNGNNGAFLTKLNRSGSALAYSTFLGGMNIEEGLGIAVDGRGRVYVTGITDGADYPTTPGAFDTTYNGEADLDTFVTKLPAG
jgi:hypothetical protein